MSTQMTTTPYKVNTTTTQVTHITIEELDKFTERELYLEKYKLIAEFKNNAYNTLRDIVTNRKIVFKTKDNKTYDVPINLLPTDSNYFKVYIEDISKTETVIQLDVFDEQAMHYVIKFLFFNIDVFSGDDYLNRFDLIMDILYIANQFEIHKLVNLIVKYCTALYCDTKFARKIYDRYKQYPIVYKPVYDALCYYCAVLLNRSLVNKVKTANDETNYKLYNELPEQVKSDVLKVMILDKVHHHAASYSYIY